MRNIHIYPSAFLHESRILKEAATLRASLGFDEIVLVGVRTGDLPAVQKIADGITLHRLGPAKGRGMAAKLVLHILWCLNVFFFCLRQRPACVNCHSLPVLPIGTLVKLFTRARLVYDAHELETETSGLGGMRKKAAKWVERLFVRTADLIIVVSPGIEDWYRKRYGVDAIVTVLNVPRHERLATTGLLRKNLGIPAEKRILLYQGGLAAGRGVRQLLDAAPGLDAAGYVIVFMGYGVLQPAIEDAAREGGNVFFHPAVPPAKLMAYTVSADVGIASIEDSCLSYHLCLPNKLFEYVMAGLPVIVSKLPEMVRVADGNHIGVSVETFDAASLTAALARIDAMRGPALDARIADVAVQNSWEVQELKLVAAYRKYIVKA